jgi:lipoyl-dependent peroxiredoxin
MSTKEKVIFTGRTHTTGGRDGAASSSDDFIDIKLPQPHPAAENLFAIAWSACFIGVIEVAAGQRKIKLPATPAVDAQVDLNMGDGGYFLRAHLKVSVPGVDREIAEELVEAAHGICPYSKATGGNIEVATEVV